MYMYIWDIIGLCETRWCRKGEFHHDQHKAITSGREDNQLKEGVAVIMNEKATKTLIGYQLISQRLMSAKFRNKFAKMTVIQTYASTSPAANEEIDASTELKDMTYRPCWRFQCKGRPRKRYLERHHWEIQMGGET